MFKRYIEGFADYKDMYSKRTAEVMRNAVFRKVLVGDGSFIEDGNGTVYVRNVTEMLETQLNLSKEGIVYSVKNEEGIFNRYSPNMTTAHNDTG